MHLFDVDKGVYPIGSLVRKYKAIIEAVNWLIFTALVIHLSYIISWYLLASLFVLPVIGAAFASCVKRDMPLVYLFGMPLFLIIFLVKTFS